MIETIHPSIRKLSPACWQELLDIPCLYSNWTNFMLFMWAKWKFTIPALPPSLTCKCQIPRGLQYLKSCIRTGLDWISWLVYLGNYPGSPVPCCRCWSDWDGSPATSSGRSARAPAAPPVRLSRAPAPSPQRSRVTWVGKIEKCTDTGKVCCQISSRSEGRARVTVEYKFSVNGDNNGVTVMQG